MKVKILLFLSVFCLGLWAQADLISVDSPELNTVIDDGSSVPTVFELDVDADPELDTILSVEVTLYLTGSAGDFYAQLLTPDGTKVVLLNRVGSTSENPLGSAADGFNVTFSLTDNQGDIHLTDVSSGLIEGTWDADGRENTLNVVDTDPRTAGLNDVYGDNPSGTWTLSVADLQDGGGSGQLVSWGLDIQAVPEPAVASLIGISGLLMLLIRRRVNG